MAKQASTINLESAVWDEIKDFMKANNINRNTAIEWMILERRSLLNVLKTNKVEISSTNTIPDTNNKSINTIDEIQQDDDFLIDSINDNFDFLD